MKDKERLHDSVQDSDAEANMLHTLATYEARVEEYHDIAEEEAAWEDIEMADDDVEMADDDEGKTDNPERGKKLKVEERTKETKDG